MTNLDAIAEKRFIDAAAPRASVSADLLRIIVAATKMHDALYYGKTDVVLGLPKSVVEAYGELQRALRMDRRDDDLRRQAEASRFARTGQASAR